MISSRPYCSIGLMTGRGVLKGAGEGVTVGVGVMVGVGGIGVWVGMSLETTVDTISCCSCPESSVGRGVPPSGVKVGGRLALIVSSGGAVVGLAATAIVGKTAVSAG